MNNWFALLLTFLIAFLWLRLCDFLVSKSIVSSQVSRKIIHIGTGPIFVLTWLFFNEQPAARWLAALVPLLITLQFLFTGLGIIKDKKTIQSMSRTGDPKELLKGPLYYGIVFVIITIIFWKNSMIGITALMILCGGDGLADLFGNKFGSRNLPWSKQKTFAGSIGFLIGSFFLVLGVILVYTFFGVFQENILHLLVKIFLICFCAMVIEGISPQNWDNITIPIISIIVGGLVFA